MTPREARIWALRRLAEEAAYLARQLATGQLSLQASSNRDLLADACSRLCEELRQQAIDLEDASHEKVVRRKDRVKP